MIGTSHSLIELVHALEFGIAFYENAMREATDPRVADIFFRMQQTKKTIAMALTAEIVSHPAVAHKDGTWILALRQGYADIGNDLARGANAVHALGIEAQEDRLLDAFRLIAASDPSESVRAVVQRQLPAVQRMHTEISNLTRSWAA